MSHHKNSAPAPAPETTDQINDDVDSGKSPEGTPGENFGVDADPNDVTDYDTRAKGLSVPNKNPATVILENPDDATFQGMFWTFDPASDFVGSTQSTQWQDIGSKILDAYNTFRQDLMTLDDKGDWKGKTHDAAMANLNQSLAESQALVNGIGTQAALLDAFTDTIFQTRWYFEKWVAIYNTDLGRWPHHRDEVLQSFDAFAQKVISTVYQPNIQEIADANPAFTSGDPISINDPGNGDGGPNSDEPPKDPPPPDGPPMTLPDPAQDPPPGPPDPNDPNDPNAPDLSDLINGAGKDLSNLGSNIGNDVGAGLSNLLGGPNGGGAGGDGFDSSQLPGGPNADFNALPPPGAGGTSDGLDPSLLPEAGAVSALLPDGTTDGFDPSQLPGAGDVGAVSPGGVGAVPPGGVSGDGFDPSQLPGGPNGSVGDPGAGLGSLGGLTSGLGGLGSPSGGGSGGAASGLGNQLSSALGPASDALKQAEGAGQSPGSGMPGGIPGGMPASGMPGMDPKGLDALKGAGPEGAHAGGGGGAGIGGRGLDPSRPGGAPVAGIGKGPAMAVAGAPRPGAPGQAGGSGSPPGGGGGGQRGPGGKEHKASKALRRKRNGDLVIGEPDAVVPVIGDDGVDTEAAEPSVPQPVPAGAAPPARRSAAAANPRRPGAEQLRAELEL